MKTVFEGYGSYTKDCPFKICLSGEAQSYERKVSVAYPGIFFGGGGSTNSVEDRGQNGDLGCGRPLVRGSGGICNLVQEIPFPIAQLS